jgi:hypothetical protein
LLWLWASLDGGRLLVVAFIELLEFGFVDLTLPVIDLLELFGDDEPGSVSFFIETLEVHDDFLDVIL